MQKHSVDLTYIESIEMMYTKSFELMCGVSGASVFMEREVGI
jgi:hypothetical protein